MLAAIANAFNCVLSLFTLTLLGFILARRGWFSPESKALLPRLVTLITLPPYLFRSIVTSFSREELVSLISGVAVPAISIMSTFGLSLIIARLARLPRNRAGIFTTAVANSNTIFIGLPVNLALFGEAALPYVLLYFFANSFFFWTIGNYQISLSGVRAPEKLFSPAALRHLLLSPPLAGFALGLLAVLLDVRPPRFLMDAADYLGGLTTPLALLFIGLNLAAVSLKSLAPDRDVWLLLLGRFVLSPLTVIFLIHIIDGIPPLMGQVFVIQSSLPTSVSAAVLAEYHKADSKFASTAVALTTVLSLVTIPGYMAIVSLLAAP